MTKKQMIFETALKLFNTRGFDRTPTALIAKESGVANGTLFHYFNTKEDLINELYLSCKDDMVLTIMSGISEEKTYRAKFGRAYKNIIKWGINSNQKFLFFQQYSNSPNIQETTRAQCRVIYAPIWEMIREGIEKDILKDLDMDYILNTIVGIINSNVTFLMMKPELANDEAFLEQSFSVLWDAARK